MPRAKWTDSEVELLQTLAMRRLPHADIAAALDRSLKSVRTKLDYLKRPEVYREKVRKRYAAENPYTRAVEDREILESRPTEEMWFARDLRMSAPFRNLTGFLQGDPRLGYSALDWRSA
jgi:hypothetical protein